MSEILNVEIPIIRLPIYPGKNISVIAETIAMNQLLKIYGQHTAKQFEKKLIRNVRKKRIGLKEYLARDFE